MTKREARYLFIIHTLALYQRHLIDDTNRHIEQAEQQATERLQARVKELAQADAMTLEAVWQEREAYRLELERLRTEKPKAGKAKRWRAVEE